MPMSLGSNLLPTLLLPPRRSRAAVVSLQNERLRRLVTHAYHNVPYYRDLFDRHNLTPQDIRTAADLALIPLTSKKDLRELPAKHITARGVNPANLITHTTSGSTGEPFGVRRTWCEERMLNFLRIRALKKYGARLRDRATIIRWAAPVHPRDRQLPARLAERLGFMRRTTINCLLSPEEIIRELRRSPPDILGGYAGVLARVAACMGNAERSEICPRVVITGGEVLTAQARLAIEAGFGAPLYDTYGSYEFNLIASQCPRGGESYHTCDDGVIVEVLANNREVAAGEDGEVVATALHSFAMPIIRYRLDDIATKGTDTCACGAPFKTIKAIRGRTVDYFRLPGGRLLHPYALDIAVLRDRASWVREYQFAQESEDLLVLRVAPIVVPSPERLAQMEAAASAILCDAAEMKIEIVSQLPRESNGKSRIYRVLGDSTQNTAKQKDESGHRQDEP